MKTTSILLMSSSVSAMWGIWEPAYYCDPSAEVIGTTDITYEYSSIGDCISFCHDADSTSSTELGTLQCCDFESWQDGSGSCTLFNSGDQIPNDFQWDGSNDFFASFVFGSYEYTVDAIQKGDNRDPS